MRKIPRNDQSFLGDTRFCRGVLGSYLVAIRGQVDIARSNDITITDVWVSNVGDLLHVGCFITLKGGLRNIAVAALFRLVNLSLPTMDNQISGEMRRHP